MSFEVDDLVLFIEVKALPALPAVAAVAKGEDEDPNNDVFVSVLLFMLLLPNTDDGDDAPPKAVNDDGVFLLLLLLLLLAPKTDVGGVFLLPNADTNAD
jgi:hypothetical protein